jgi:predicted nucleic acid-binding protein
MAFPNISILAVDDAKVRDGGPSESTAAHHARLIAYVRRTGTPRGAHDLIIAAHAAESGRTVLSLDAKARFGSLPGVITIEAS